MPDGGRGNCVPSPGGTVKMAETLVLKDAPQQEGGDSRRSETPGVTRPEDLVSCTFSLSSVKCPKK